MPRLFKQIARSNYGTNQFQRKIPNYRYLLKQIDYLIDTSITVSKKYVLKCTS